MNLSETTVAATAEPVQRSGEMRRVPAAAEAVVVAARSGTRVIERRLPQNSDSADLEVQRNSSHERTGYTGGCEVTTEPRTPAEHQVERLLRAFRTAELTRRTAPTTRRLVVDVLSRTVPLALGYLGMMRLDRYSAVAAAVVFAVANVSMLGSWFHDGVHGCAPGPRLLSRPLMRVAAAPAGFGPLWWQYKHVRLHHRYPGDPQFDPDIQFGVLGRVSRAQRRRRLHATQHVHMWLLLPFTTLAMLKPVELWRTRTFGRLLGGQPMPRSSTFLVDRYLPMALVWAPLFVTRPGGQALSMFACFHVVVGTLVSLVTQVQHNTALTQSDDPLDWEFKFWEQIRRSSDITSRFGLWWWLTGGTNMHAAHHLIPTVSFLELPAVTRRLRVTLRSVNLDVPTHPGFLSALSSHARLIRTLSRGA